MEDLERTYSPAEAAEHFDFAPSLLRRYAGIYEATGGTIPHDKRGGRLYSHRLLEHFSAARERVKTGETVEDALLTLDLAPTEAVRDAQAGIDAKHLLDLFERLADANEHIVQEVAELRVQVAQVQRQLETDQDQKALSVSPAESEWVTGRVLVRMVEKLERLWQRVSGQGGRM